MQLLLFIFFFSSVPPLRHSVMPNRRTSDEDRARIAGSYERGEDFVALASSLGVKRTTAYAVVGCFARQGRTSAMEHAGGRPKKIDDETIDFISTLIEADPLKTLKQLVDDVRAIWPDKPHFSEATLSRALEGELYSVKLARDCPTERNSERVKDERHHYAQWMLGTGINLDRVYIDETGFNLWTRRAYGRSHVGTRVNRIIGGQRGRNATIITAIFDKPSNGILYYEIHFGKINKNIFNSFMQSLNTIIGDAKPVVIMDNAPIHIGVANDFPEMNIKMLPPYSPFLNPIENCFSVLKSDMKRTLNEKREMCTAEEAARLGTSVCALREHILRDCAEQALPCINHRLVAEMYAHANTYLMRCLQKEDIFN